MSDHVTPESAFFSAEEKVQILSAKCPGITKGRLKVWLSFRKGTARDGSASSDGTKAVLLQRSAFSRSVVCVFEVCVFETPAVFFHRETVGML